MKISFRLLVSIILLFSFLLNVLPIAEACGPYYLSPVFDYKYAPQNSFDDFAEGKIGIVKPSYHRVVLFAAYRYLNGGSFTADEQKALVDVWNADFNNKDYAGNDVGEAVKLWLDKRKDVVGKEDKLPAIYTEREYGGYDFFPNCTKNAFETAAQTLSDRAASYGADSRDVKDWVAAQDAVFTNCASGKQMPEPFNQTMPEWLQKDRAYQLAAAAFYSLDYEKAKNDFAEIAKDNDSPWRETADYLVARTLIRQASLTADEIKRGAFYREAEERLQNLSSSGGKFADSSEKFMNLIKYRLHPQERVGELAQTFSNGGNNTNFRQDLIDYYWLLDKFEEETLEKEEKRKEDLKLKDENVNSNMRMSNSTMSGGFSNTNMANSMMRNGNTSGNAGIYSGRNVNSDDAEYRDMLSIHFYSDDYKQNWIIHVKLDATNEEVIAEAEKVSGKPLTDKMKDVLRSERQTAYGERFKTNAQPEYQGGYYGEEKISLSLFPDFLRRDDLTDWLFAYQVTGAEAYLYALDKFRQTGADLWLMTAISKAETSSSGLKNLLEAADRTNRFSAAYPTIAYQETRILIAQGKQAEARKVLDEILDHSDNLPISSRNQFLEQRASLAQTLDDFLRDSLKTPFAFESDGQTETIDELIEREKSYYNPETDKQSKEDYEREVEDRYKNEKLLENQRMFDDKAINVINEHFPLAVLFDVEKSSVLPEYLKERIALAIWTRAVLLKDDKTANKIIPEIIRLNPDAETMFAAYLKAKTPAERQNAALYLILKNENLSPYIAAGFGSSFESYKFSTSRWWCLPVTEEFSKDEDKVVSRPLSYKPKFLTPTQSLIAQGELKQLEIIGYAPRFFAVQVFDWAKRSPLDKRVPESLYIVYEANGWDKYGCGGNEDLRIQAGNILKKRYPKSEWTSKLAEEAQ